MAKKSVPLAQQLRPGEEKWLDAVVADLGDDALKLVYADWLEEQGDPRSDFLRAFVAASRSMNASDTNAAHFPIPEKLPEEWLELIGFRLLERAARVNLPELKDRVLKLARPALRMKTTKASDGRIAIGASKIGGLPDLPPGFAWPLGDDCKAMYNDSTKGVEELAGFLAQINCAKVAQTQAGRLLPEAGLLSFFCFQDVENDNPDVIGAKAVFFGKTSDLVRTTPPGELTEGNEVMPSQRLTFEETLDLPTAWDGPWSEELDPKTGYTPLIGHFRSLNFENVLGYARSTTRADPTPSKQSRHLILLENSVGCRLHIQISQEDLAARRFDKITLNWVDMG